MAAKPDRRASVSTKESSSEHAPGLTQPHHGRRMSRMENPALMGHLAMPGGNRRMSMFRRPSIAGSRRSDQSSIQRPSVKLENTYRLGPEEDEKFNSSRIQKALHSILESFLAGEIYEQNKCTQLAKNLSEVVKARVKEMHFPRYKFVCNVIIGENSEQCLQSCSRFLWNTDTDNFAAANYKNGSLFAIATVYGLYFE